MKKDDLTQTIFQPPMRRIITVNPSHYFLSFPKMKFKIDANINANKSYCEIMLQGLTISFLLDKRYKAAPFLPNLYWQGQVCMGNFVHNTFPNMETLIRETISEFWSSLFDNQWTVCTDFVKRKSIHKYFKEWQQRTKEDPKWIPDKKFFGIIVPPTRH